ncbi:NAD(P)H-dependent oxidoreductase|uniref:Putative NADPH-quinone reductase (Modulator of drug activity B) n=1 Tax=Dendrosporobacter quercicolus TaxID=146817 RepID=A0A1G9NR75_9FIRM|nr:NAD(P)H-dependent oxidoreductase [Dendrosporobacter quercicolus]NSL47425.1 NAD(P)H-dependent oxidoreductase [Dendrosporobacter quercicolus DSM 1736]SDL88879.1 Putative NADPH-quinone reductase (modulator of drug activity B) [Dendrosporobacter quercicolus]
MTTILFAHPWHGSFNKMVFDTAVTELEKKGKAYQIIDLNKDGFNPVFTQEELALYSQGKYSDPLVGKYQKILKASDALIVIFPIWWFDVPAILKGFFDKVMLKDFAYIETRTGLKGLLGDIKRTTVITTSNSPKWYIEFFAGNPIKGVLIKSNLKGMGLRNVKWLHCGDLKKEAVEKRLKFLNEIKKHVT